MLTFHRFIFTLGLTSRSFATQRALREGGILQKEEKNPPDSASWLLTLNMFRTCVCEFLCMYIQSCLFFVFHQLICVEKFRSAILVCPCKPSSFLFMMLKCAGHRTCYSFFLCFIDVGLMVPSWRQLRMSRSGLSRAHSRFQILFPMRRDPCRSSFA